jgi:hypothetical protein
VKTELKNSYFNEFGRIIPSNSEKKNGEILIELVFSDTEIKHQYRYKLVLGWRLEKKLKFKRHETFFLLEEFDYKNIHKTGPAINIFKRKDSSILFGKGLRKLGLTKIPESVSVIGLLKVLTKQFSDNEISDALKSLNAILKTETVYFSNIELSKPGKSRLTKFSGRTVAFDVIDEIVNLFTEGKNFDYFKEALKAILKIDEVQVIEIGAEKEEETGKTNKEYLVFFRHFGSTKSLWDFSDGSILLIALITKILISDSDILFIEEPENSLHPKALIDLINFIRSYEDEKQFIIATHSIALINKVGAEDVIISKCQPNGISELIKVADSTELKKTLKQGFIVFSDLLFFSPEEIV